MPRQPRTTQHTQDPSYKPLFTDSVSQRKKLQEMQLQMQNYDRVIRNSYDRLSASNQALLAQATPAKLDFKGTPLRRSSTPNNADLHDVVLQDLATLDQRIQFEEELARQMPFAETTEL